MTEELGAMSVAYLLTAQSGVDISKHAGDEAVKALIERGWLRRDYIPSTIGRYVVEDVMKVAKQAGVCSQG